MDGTAALQILRAGEATRHIKVLAITASAMRGDRERILAAGFDGYVSKPFRVQELLEAVRRMLEQAPG
jgi:two-component system cell cycle response regulator DivK